MTVPAADAEIALAEATAALGCGCRERTGPAGEGVLDFWVPAPSADPAGLERLLGVGGIVARVEAHPEGDAWRDAMRVFHRPVEVGGRLLVRPPWVPARARFLDVEIDPGMAFGTAQHATTRSCLELLCDLPPGGPLLDAGCGSGILSIAARRLGFDPVWSVDFDPLSVAATVENARRNGVGLRVGRRTIGADPLPATEVVLANLTATVLALLAPALPPPGPRWLIASGMRPEEVSGVAARFVGLGLRPARTTEAEGWSTVLLERA